MNTTLLQTQVDQPCLLIYCYHIRVYKGRAFMNTKFTQTYVNVSVCDYVKSHNRIMDDLMYCFY